MAEVHQRQSVVWTPSAEDISNCALSAFVRYTNANYGTSICIGDYKSLHKRSVENAALFWHAFIAFADIPMHPKPAISAIKQVASVPSLPALVNVSWFPNSTVNPAEIILRYAHITPSRKAIAFHPEDCSKENIQYLSFSELAENVYDVAKSLREAGVKKGDAVAAVVSNNPQAIIALLATAAIGAVWSSCPPEFGVPAIVSRFSQTCPKILFYSPQYTYKHRTHDVTKNICSVVKAVPSIQTAVALPTANDAKCEVDRYVKHFFWREFQCHSDEIFLFERLTMSDPFVTMFSSGTTGRPKCIVQGTGILINQLKEHLLHQDVSHSSTIYFATSTGWMLFNWLVAALGAGATIVQYDGAPVPPQDPLLMIRIAATEHVTHFGSGAKYYQTLDDLLSKTPSLAPRTPPIPTLRQVLGTGSPSTVQNFRFASRFFGSHVQYCSISGGTEINGCFALGCPWKPVTAPELQCAGLGMDVCVFNSDGERIVGQKGELVCRNASPCMPLYFVQDENHERYRDTYFVMFGDHVWSHGDFAEESKDGGFAITGRSDSTLNPGGVRIGTADVYEVIEKLTFVEDSLVTDQPYDGDSRVIMLVVLKEGTKMGPGERKEICSLIRNQLSPRHVPHAIVHVPQLPYTFSGKKCEIPVKKLLQGEKLSNIQGVKNPEAFDLIRQVLEENSLLEKEISCLPTSKM